MLMLALDIPVTFCVSLLITKTRVIKPRTERISTSMDLNEKVVVTNVSRMRSVVLLCLFKKHKGS